MSSPDDEIPGRRGRDVRHVGIGAMYTPAGGEPVPVRVIARLVTIVGVGKTRIPLHRMAPWLLMHGASPAWQLDGPIPP